MNNNIAFPDYTDGPIGRVRGYNWYRAQKQRDQQPIRGTQIAVTQNSDTPTICGRLLDQSVTAGGALGAIPINSGAIGINNLGGTAYPAPTLQGSPTLTSSGTPLACDVTVQCTVNNVPQDGNVAQVLWLFRRNGTSTWTPWAEVPLSGLPYPPASQAISFGFGQLQAGLAYDFGIAYISARGDLGAITAVKTNYAVTAVSIPSSYMLGGTAINPAVGSLSNTIGASTNGISTPCTINWTCTNQPTDGSLSRVAIWFRQAQAGATVGSSGTAQAGAWAYYASLPAVGVNLASPPASASYSFVFTDLANGISYDFGFSYENAQGGETNVTAGFVGITMPNVLAQNKMPTAQMNNGPQLTVTLQSPLTGAGTANPIAVVGATIGDWTANNAPSWFLGLRTFLRVHGQTTYQNVGDITPGQNVTFNTQVALGAAQAWDIGFAYLDNAGNVSTIVWPAALSNINAPAVGPTGINSLGGPNLVPDSGFNYANFNSSGIGSNDPYWNFYLIDGASFFIGRGSGNGNYLGVRPGDSNKTCKAQSEVMVAQANTLYTVSAYIDATTCSGANQPYIALVSTDQATEYTRASQTIGKNGIVSAQYTTPASGGPTQFTVMFNSNNCTINSSILVFAQPMLQVGNLGPYTAGPSVSGGAPSGTGNNPPPAGGSGGGAADPGSGSGDGGGYHKNKTMPYQVRGVVSDSAAADNSYLQTGVISGRHFLGGNASDTSAFVDSSSNLLYGRHHVSVRTALSSTAGTDGSYLNSSQIYDRHISSVKLDTISDGTTYQRMPTSNMDANRRALIDFTQSHLGKNLDNVADGTTYGALPLANISGTGTAKRALIDFTQSHVGKNLDNIADGATYGALPLANITGTGTAKRALIDFTQGHANKNLDNIADGATYVSLPAANITGTGTSKRALIDFTQAHVGKNIDNIAEGTTNKYFNGKTLDNLPDGSTYNRVNATAITSGNIDFAKGGFANKNLDNVADGTTYASLPKVNIAGTGTAKRALIDFTQSHVGKNLDNIADGATYGALPLANITGTGTAKRALIDFTQGHANKSLDNIPDGATYASLPVANITGTGTAKRALIDFSQGHANKTIDNVGDGSTYARVKTTELTTGYVSRLNDGTNSRTAANLAAIVDTSNNFLASDFPGGTVHQNTGAYKGWELITGNSPISNLGCTDSVGVTMNGEMVWTEWTAVLTNTANGYGPAFYDANLTGMISADFYSGSGEIYATQGSAQTVTAISGMASNNSNNGLPHTYLLGVQYISGTNPTATWRVVAYIDGAKVFDQFITANFNNAKAFAGFRADIGSTAYVRDFKVWVGNDALEKTHAVLQSVGAGVLQKNLVVNGNNYNGTGAVAPGAFGWTGSYVGGTVVSGGTYSAGGVNYTSFSTSYSSGGNCGVYQDIPVIPGQTYTFCALIYVGSGTGSGRLFIGDTALSQAFNSSPGMPVGALGKFYTSASNSINGFQTSVNSAWQVVYGTFTVPNGSYVARVLLQNLTTNGNVCFQGVQVTQGNRLQDYADHEPNPSYLASSSPLKQQASIAPIGIPGVSASGSYPSGGTPTITVSWGSGMAYFPDGSTASITAGSWSQSGLSANVTYHTCVYADTSGGVHVVFIGSSAPTLQQKFQNCYVDSRICISDDCYATTPQAFGGTGGGGGGGGVTCPSIDQVVETKEYGFVPAREYYEAFQRGEQVHLRGPEGEWVQLLDARLETSQMFLTTIAGETYETDVNHYWLTAEEQYVRVVDLTLNTVLRDKNGTLREIDKIEKGDLKMYVKTRVKGGAFVIGHLIGHNTTTL